MSEFIEVEWFGRDHKIGIVLTYDDFDGFKARMAPLPMAYLRPIGYRGTEADDIKWLMQNAAKIPFEWAWGIFGRLMESKSDRATADGFLIVRYDRRDYSVKTLEEVKHD